MRCGKLKVLSAPKTRAHISLWLSISLVKLRLFGLVAKASASRLESQTNDLILLSFKAKNSPATAFIYLAEVTLSKERPFIQILVKNATHTRTKKRRKVHARVYLRPLVRGHLLNRRRRHPHTGACGTVISRAGSAIKTICDHPFFSKFNAY